MLAVAKVFRVPCARRVYSRLLGKHKFHDAVLLA